MTIEEEQPPDPPNPEMVGITYELARMTSALLHGLPLNVAYRLAREWELVCPEFFTTAR